MSEFTPLKRSEAVNEKLRSAIEPNPSEAEGFSLLTKSDKAASFSYSLERIGRQIGGSAEGLTGDDADFAPMTRALSFAHKGLGASTKDTINVLPKGASLLQKGQKRIVGVVDTFSTGALIVDSLIKQGFRVIRILSADLNPELLEMVLAGLSTAFEGTVTFNTSIADHSLALDDLIRQIDLLMIDGELSTSSRIAAIIAGAETGVELADSLTERLGLRTNGTHMSEARRNKYVMGETVRMAGIRAVKQLRSSVWSEIEHFLDEWSPNPFKVIVKPLDSAGSDGVTLCLSKADVFHAYNTLIGKINGLGFCNKSVLVQEYLEGQEYVIDIVSRDGEHKVVAIWEYDRRAVNGASFVCFGQRLMTADEPRCSELVAYQKKVITALGIQHGPTHGEVKWFQGEPVLVEVGARCHGGEGAWVDVANEVFGYNQAQTTINAYLDPEAFNEVPSLPLVRKAYGYMKWLVVTESVGKLVSFNEKAITSLKSYRGHQFFLHPGDIVRPTVDCFTWAGYVKLANEDFEQVTRDYASLGDIEKRDLILTATPDI